MLTFLLVCLCHNYSAFGIDGIILKNRHWKQSLRVETFHVTGSVESSSIIISGERRPKEPVKPVKKTRVSTRLLS